MRKILRKPTGKGNQVCFRNMPVIEWNLNPLVSLLIFANPTVCLRSYRRITQWVPGNRTTPVLQSASNRSPSYELWMRGPLTFFRWTYWFHSEVGVPECMGKHPPHSAVLLWGLRGFTQVPTWGLLPPVSGFHHLPYSSPFSLLTPLSHPKSSFRTWSSQGQEETWEYNNWALHEKKKFLNETNSYAVTVAYDTNTNFCLK